jgi:hypothetical protein
MFELTWQEFSRRGNIKKLPIHEQIRQFQFAQQQFEMQQRHIMNSVSINGQSYGGYKSNTDTNTSTTSYLVDDYVDDYVE